MKMKYFSQHANRVDGWRTCGTTSLAMALSALGINVTPDTLTRRAYALGMDVTEVGATRVLAAEYGVEDLYTDRGTLQGIKSAIDKKRPVILRGNFTGSGHVIAVEGYDKNGLEVKDPNGEWFWDGYDTSLTGDNLHYSFAMIAKNCSPESINNPQHIWFHQLYKK